MVAGSLPTAPAHRVAQVAETGKLDVVVWTEEVHDRLGHERIAEVVGVGRVGQGVTGRLSALGQVVYAREERHLVLAAR